jgi:hypothetical protein
MVALLPLVALLGVVLWQGAVVGQAAWLGGGAARAAARASAVGQDPEAAARRELPATLERGLRVRDGDDGEVEVSLRLPRVVGIALGRASFRARMEPQQ